MVPSLDQKPRANKLKTHEHLDSVIDVRGAGSSGFSFLLFFCFLLLFFVTARCTSSQRSGATSSREWCACVAGRVALCWLCVCSSLLVASLALSQTSLPARLTTRSRASDTHSTTHTAPHRIQSAMACCTGSAAAAPAPAAAADSGRRRTYEEECKFLRRLDANSFEIQMGFVPNMKVKIQTRIAICTDRWLRHEIERRHVHPTAHS